jgi:hypothetical protein
MKIRDRKCKNCAGRLPFSRGLCSPLFLKSAGKATKEKHGYVASTLWYELPARPQSEPR